MAVDLPRILVEVSILEKNKTAKGEENRFVEDLLKIVAAGTTDQGNSLDDSFPHADQGPRRNHLCVVVRVDVRVVAEVGVVEVGVVEVVVVVAVPSASAWTKHLG